MPKFLSRINLPQYPSAPSSPVQGDMYYNTTADTVYVHDGASWIDLAAGGGGAGDITEVVAGTGLTGGATSGSVTLSVDTSTIATKNYADTLVAGMNWHSSVHYATAAALPNSPVYTAGTLGADGGYGIGATLAGTTNGALVIDGGNPLSGKRVLVKNQADEKQNGIYVVTNAGSAGSTWLLTRTADANNRIAGQIASGDAVFTLPGYGVANAFQGFILASVGEDDEGNHIIGTSNLTWYQFTGSATFLSGDGIDATGNTINVAAGVGLTFIAGDLAVSLSNSTSSSSETSAATPLAVKNTYDHADTKLAKSLLTGKGAIITATADSVPSTLTPGNDGTILMSVYSNANGLGWVAPSYAAAENPSVTGKLLIDNNPSSPASLLEYDTSASIHLVGNNSQDNVIVIDSYGTGSDSEIALRSSRGTGASQSAIQSGDGIGKITMIGYGTSAFASGHSIELRGKATQNFTNSAYGAKLEIAVTGNSTSSETIAATISPSSIELPNGSVFKIDGAQVLSTNALGSGVTSSSLTSVGTIGTGTWQGSAVGIAYGGTGQTTASGAINALLPSQTSNSGKLLQTNGSNVSWYTLNISNETIDGGSA